MSAKTVAQKVKDPFDSQLLETELQRFDKLTVELHEKIRILSCQSCCSIRWTGDFKEDLAKQKHSGK